MTFLKNRFNVLLIFVFVIIIFLIIFLISYKQINNTVQINKSDLKDYNFNDFNRMKPPDNRFMNGIYAFGIMGFFGLLAGAIIFYFLSNKLIKTENVQKKNTKIILNFLSKEEKQIIEKIISNNGEIYQYELNRLEGVSKIKAHRILLNLENKEIIYKQNLGKVNKIILNKELYEVLK